MLNWVITPTSILFLDILCNTYSVMMNIHVIDRILPAKFFLLLFFLLKKCHESLLKILAIYGRMMAKFIPCMSNDFIQKEKARTHGCESSFRIFPRKLNTTQNKLIIILENPILSSQVNDNVIKENIVMLFL